MNLFLLVTGLLLHQCYRVILVVLFDVFYTCLFSSGSRPEMPQLIGIQDENGQWLRISDIIASNTGATCDKFAHVLLNHPVAVQTLKSENKSGKEEYILAVLRSWLYSTTGPAKPCSWENLLVCMEQAGVDGYSIKQIRDALMLLPGKLQLR